MRYWECKCGALQAFGSDPPEPCVVCSRCNTNAFKKEPEPHDFRIQHDVNTGEPKYSMCIKCHERRPVPVAKPIKDSPLLAAVKLAYRKHHLGDDSIGWDELSEALLNALCNSMGDEGFQAWLKEVTE